MKHIFLPVIIFFSIGLLTSCGGSNKQTSETEQSRYGINYSDTSTIKKDHKNVLVISSSPRREGNTDLLCDEFVRGAKEAGARVEKIFLGDYDIKFFQEADEQHVGDSAEWLGMMHR